MAEAGQPEQQSVAKAEPAVKSVRSFTLRSVSVNTNFLDENRSLPKGLVSETGVEAMSTRIRQNLERIMPVQLIDSQTGKELKFPWEQRIQAESTPVVSDEVLEARMQEIQQQTDLAAKALQQETKAASTSQPTIETPDQRYILNYISRLIRLPQQQFEKVIKEVSTLIKDAPLPAKAVLVAWMLAGCANGQASPTPGVTTPPPIVSPSASTSAEVSLSPTASPTEAPTLTPEAAGIVSKDTWVTDKGEIKKVPVPAHLEAVLQTNGTDKSINFKTTDGYYGIKAETEVGYFKTDVYEELNGKNVQVGGDILDGRIVAKLIQSKLDSTSEHDKKLAIAIPVAPQAKDDPISVNFTIKTTPANEKISEIVVKGNAMDLVNIIPNNGGINFNIIPEGGSYDGGKWEYYDVNYDFATDKKPLDPMNAIDIRGPVAPTSGHLQTNPKYPIGGHLGTVSTEIDIFAGTATPDKIYNLDASSLVTVGGGALVFPLDASAK